MSKMVPPPLTPAELDATLDVVPDVVLRPNGDYLLIFNVPSRHGDRLAVCRSGLVFHCMAEARAAHVYGDDFPVDAVLEENAGVVAEEVRRSVLSVYFTP
jgi:hypothetical protein